MKSVANTLLALFLLVSGNLYAGNEAAADSGVNLPLLRYKLALAQDARAGFHIATDSLVIYFRGVALKELPVIASESMLDEPLVLSRVSSWSPPRKTPVLDLSGKESLPSLDPLAHTLRLEDMPDTFAVKLASGASVFVTSEESNLRVFRDLRKGQNHALPAPPTNQMILMLMDPDAARQFYWALSLDAGVIY